MTKFEALSPEQVKRAEQKALKNFSAEVEGPIETKPVEAVRYAGDKEYKSLTPSWIKTWFQEHLPPLVTKRPKEQEASRPVEPKAVEELAEKSRVLGRFKSMFPLMLFPDELIVEENRVVWKNWLGPGSTEVTSIMATDISNVQASHSPISGHIHVGSLVGGPEILVEKLSRKDVVAARALIEGIIITGRERVDVRAKEVTKEKEELSKIGDVQF